MPLGAGVRLGPYEILSALGAGGMGEVYRARDTKLGRDVAIKILPELFVTDPERVARFEREAQLVAALNHPHIGAIYGFDQVATTHFLVLELVEGESLDARLKSRAPDTPDGARGFSRAIPIDESLRIARQIVNALEAAHEKGIVHRDLKPANIMLTADGDVKVLDFGLAKATGGGDPGAAGVSPAPLTHSPTLTFAATQAGMILGTAAYMAPEQAKGRAADKRCDVWAFGCVLFEMLTGARAFGGEDATEVIAAVVRGEPDWNALPAGTPPHVVTLVKRCLEKDRKKRIPDISVVRFLLDDADATNPALRGLEGAVSLSNGESRTPNPVAMWRRALPWAIAAATTLAAAAALLTRPAPTARPLVRLRATAPRGLSLAIDPFAADVAIAPDGRRIAYTVGTAQPQLYVRELDRDEGTPLADIENVRGPFFSPDGAWIAYFQGADLKKVSVQGGAPLAVCVGCAPGNRGGAWGADDTIVFTAQGGSLLRRVPAAGGPSVDLPGPDRSKGEAGFAFPEFVPGRNMLLYTILSGGGKAEEAVIAARDLRTGTQHVLVRAGIHGRIVADRFLVYAAAGTLRAMAFDPDRLAASGNPVPVIQQVLTKPTAAADFSVSRDGTLVYVQGNAQEAMMTLAWRDRQGREEPIPAPPRAYAHVRVSPDGTRAALDVRDQDNDIWIWDFARQTLARFTFNQGPDENATWTPDGKRIAFTSTNLGNAGLNWQAADGTGAAEKLLGVASMLLRYPWAFTSDGKWLIVRDADSKTGTDLALLRIDDKRIQPLVQQTGNQTNPDLSPDGRWLAYQSDESGRNEIYVRPFPSVDAGRWQVSTSGGSRPVWARNGRELFYLDDRFRLIAVPVQGGATFAGGNPVMLFDLPSTPTATARTYDVAPDGRFLVIKFQQADKSSNEPMLNVVLNWSDELKRLVPQAK